MEDDGPPFYNTDAEYTHEDSKRARPYKIFIMLVWVVIFCVSGYVFFFH